MHHGLGYTTGAHRIRSTQAIQTYLSHLITEKKLAYSSVNQAACAFRFLFGEVLRQPAIWPEIPGRVPKRLPVVLSREDI
ncbi:MAG: phage integrase N-terminal SAM-like domain-containing protein [Propionivibrio sp.]|nr:phage integrase N-terminal SAM-like domain-containing protein [Propionivibrio sp.]